MKPCNTTDPLAEIQARLRRVERQNRILLTLCCCVTSLVLFTAAKDSGVATEVKAHRFTLVDGKEMPSAYWTNTNGYPMLVFNGTTSVQRIEDSPMYLANSPSGAVMYLNGSSPGPESTITLTAGFNSYFAMASPHRAIFELSPTGGTQMALTQQVNGQLNKIFYLQNNELGLYNLPLRFYTGQTNVVLQLP